MAPLNVLGQNLKLSDSASSVPYFFHPFGCAICSPAKLEKKVYMSCLNDFRVELSLREYLCLKKKKLKKIGM